MEERFEGGCHCGAVRFAVVVRERVGLECSCSICRMKGFVHVIVAAADFELLARDGALTEYRFNTGVARHMFCGTCGVQSFYRPRSHPEGYSANLRCLDGDAAERFEVRPFDGANWEENVASIRG